jgi:thiosulfate/3-mercaptopyruvate sulfurtransferase
VNNPSPLIEAVALAALLTPPAEPGTARAAATPTVLDIRWRLGGSPGVNDYRIGHIPGAVFIDLDADVCGQPGSGGRHPMPDAGSLQRVLRAAGVSGHRAVVVYDAGDGMPAARLWWTLRWAGHPDVRVLDGGYAAWQRANLPTETAEAAVAPGDFTVDPGHLPMLDADAAAECAKRATLLDARTPERYRGETEPIDPVAGRIPGARNLPYAELVNPDGSLRSPEELRKAMADAGVPDGGEIGAYCGSGVTAAHTVLALTVADRPGTALYVGSWSEWITDPSRPIASGDER